MVIVQFKVEGAGAGTVAEIMDKGGARAGAENKQFRLRNTGKNQPSHTFCCENSRRQAKAEEVANMWLVKPPSPLPRGFYFL